MCTFRQSKVKHMHVQSCPQIQVTRALDQGSTLQRAHPDPSPSTFPIGSPRAKGMSSLQPIPQLLDHVTGIQDPKIAFSNSPELKGLQELLLPPTTHQGCTPKFQRQPKGGCKRVELGRASWTSARIYAEASRGGEWSQGWQDKEGSIRQGPSFVLSP